MAAENTLVLNSLGAEQLNTDSGESNSNHIRRQTVEFLCPHCAKINVVTFFSDGDEERNICPTCHGRLSFIRKLNRWSVR